MISIPTRIEIQAAASSVNPASFWMRSTTAKMTNGTDQKPRNATPRRIAAPQPRCLPLFDQSSARTAHSGLQDLENRAAQGAEDV